jgi:hypothetical protein
MECFQKNPNLRISAKRLLKIPWIANANVKKPGREAPTKSIGYQEALRSVQEWNEKVKSPEDSASLSGQGTHQESLQEPNLRISSAIRQSPVIAKSKPTTEAFRSPEVESSDNWDDDFVSSIDPKAFHLPQLRPQDNFAGLLSHDKLKSYATFEPVAEEASIDDLNDSELTVKSPVKWTPPESLNENVSRSDPIMKASALPQATNLGRRRSSLSRQDAPRTAILRGRTTLPGRRPSGNRPSNAYRESSVEDYSDLIASDDAAWERKLHDLKVK